MKTNNIMNTIFKNNLVIPNILLENYSKLNMDEKELIFASYLMSYEKDIPFDINNFCKALKYDIPSLMSIIASLTDKSLIEVITKNENNKLKEYIDISLLKNKLISLIVLEEQETNNNNNDNSKIYKKIEQEFGRTLSPIECETIKYWLDSKISEELIEEALKEAVLNGVNNLKYIDKILVEWNKKGYKNKLDIKRKKTKDEDNLDIFDYDWLDLDE